MPTPVVAQETDANPRDHAGLTGRQPHAVVLVIGGLGIVVHQLLPERWHELSYDGIEVFVLLATIWGVRNHRPRPAGPWWLLASGVWLLVVGDVIYNALTRINGAEVYPSVADALYLGSYVALTCGVIAVLRLRRSRRDRTALLDALLVTVAAVAITWVYLVAPGDYVGVSFLTRLVSAAYPVGDIVLLAFLVRLLISGGSQPPAERILGLGISLLLVADVAYARLALSETYAVGSWLDAVYHSSYLCFAVAACHPTMRRLTDSDPAYSGQTRTRLWLISAISLVLPVLAGLQMATDHETNAVILAAASAAAFFLLTFRTGVLNASLAAALGREEDALRRERILRGLGTVLVTTHDRGAIFDAAVDHARELAGDGADALLFFGDAGSAHVAGVSEALGLRDADTLLDRGLPTHIERQLLQGRAVMADPWSEGELRAVLPAALETRPLLLAPVFSGGHLRGALVVSPTHATDQQDRLAAVSEAVASAVSVALDAAELAERLVDKRSEQRFSAMIRNSSDILLVVRGDGKVRFVSPSITCVLGWEITDVVGEDLMALAHPDDAGVTSAAMLRVPGTHGPYQCRYQHKDRSWRYLEAIGTSLIDDPAVAGIIMSLRDVTERVHLAESLKAGAERLASQVEELQRLHTVKNDFVATISHELRTPLTSILGQLELLEEGDYGELVGGQGKAVAVIERNSRRLLVLIEDLLTVARIESASLELHLQPTELGPFVEAVHRSLVPTAEARSVAFEVEAQASLGALEVDAPQLQRALENVVANAIKFTPSEGLVSLRAERTADSVIFIVADNGIGIPVAEQDQIFSRFFRSSLATKHAVQGSGLGLVIAKSIVEEHNGTIELASSEGKGTTVTIALPVGNAPA